MGSVADEDATISLSNLSRIFLLKVVPSDEEERADLVYYLATNPEAGDVMPETGGVRKIRWGVEGRGKSGGVRIVYYFHDASVPLLVLDMFAKNEKANLSKAERNELRSLMPRIVKEYQKGRGR